MASEWKSTTLKEPLEFSNGRTSPARIESGQFQVFGSNGAIGRASEVNSPARTIIIGRVGSYCGSLHYSHEPCWVTDNAIKGIARAGHDPEFLHYLLQTLDLNKWRGGSGQPLLNQSTLNSIPISLPSANEQSEIAAFLGGLDRRIDLIADLNLSLESIARSIFKSWFVDFDPVRAKAEGREPEGMDAATAALFPDELEGSKSGAIPRGWSPYPLDSIADFLNGLALQKYPASSDDDSIPALKIAQLKRGSTEGADRISVALPAKYLVHDGDLIFSWSGSLEVEVWCGGECALNQHLFKVTSEAYPQWFIYGWLLQHLEHFREIAASKVTTMGHIQRHHLHEAMVVVPASEALQRLGEVIGPLHERVIQSKLQMRSLAELRDTLLPRLISGKLRVQEAEKLVGAVL